MLNDYKQYRLIKRNRLFDRDYYLLMYPEVSRADIKPLMHFIKIGWKEGKNPSSSFNTKDYLEKHPELLDSGLNPLVHYIQQHQVLRKNVLAKLIANVKYLWQYVQIKRSELFDPKYYLETYPDVRKADIDPLMHFIRIGWKEGRNPSNYFETNFYLMQNLDVSGGDINPLLHYLHYGGFEKRDPSPLFSSSWYLQHYPDVQKSKINPLVHYIKFGQNEHRRIKNANLSNQKLKDNLIKDSQEILAELLKPYSWDAAFENIFTQNSIPLPKWHMIFPEARFLNQEELISSYETVESSCHFTIMVFIDQHPIHLINQALQSIIDQTYHLWNVFVFIKNNPILDTDILNLSIDEKDNKIQFINIDRDQQPIIEVIRKANESKSDYILLLNPFDELHKHCLHVVAEKITESNPDIIISKINDLDLIKDEDLFYQNTHNFSLPIAQLWVMKKKMVTEIEAPSCENVASFFEQVVKLNDKLSITQVERAIYFHRPMPGRGIFYLKDDKGDWITSKGTLPIHLTIDARLIHRQITGTERYLTELLKGLAAVRHKYGLIISALCYQTPKENIEGVTFNFTDHKKIIRSSDVFHKTFPVSDHETLFEVASAPAVVFTPLDLILFNNPDYFNSETDNYNFRNLMKVTTHLADLVIAISHYGKEEIVSYLNRPSEKIQVVYLGVTDIQEQNKPQQFVNIFEEVNISNDYFLFVGTNFPHKNLITLLKAFKIFLKEKPDVVLVIVGASVYQKPQAELDNLLKSLEGNIITLGHVSDQTLQALYQHAKALTFPSLYEGFGLPVLEAMRHNTPVISSNCTSLPEVCGKAALFFDGTDEQQLADAMLSILTNEELRQDLIEKGQKNIERFKWELTINNTIDVYKKAIKEAASRSYSQDLDSKRSILQAFSPNRPTILLVTHVRFYPPKAGNEQRIKKLLQYLHKLGYQIIVLAYPFLGEPPLTNETKNRIHQIVDYYEEIDAIGSIGDKQDQPRSFESNHILSKWDNVENTFCPPFLVDRVEKLIDLFSPQIIIAEYIWTSRIFSVVPDDRLKMVDLIDLFSQKNEGVERFGIKDELATTWEEELAFINRTDIAIAIQSVEANKLREKNPDCEVITAGIDYDYEETTSINIHQHSLLIIGSGNHINNHCVNEFLSQAWPSILSLEPACTLTIVGKVCHSITEKPDNVTLIPYAENLSPFYLSADIVINPVYAGTGLKIKSVEAIAHGKALIAWPEGVSGIDAEPPYPFITVEHWSDFPETVIKTLHDRGYRSALEKRAVEYTKFNLKDHHVYREVADRIDIHSRRTIKILCLFLRYGPDDYPHSLEKLTQWYQAHQNNLDFSLTIWIIDNKIPKEYDGIDLKTGFRLISGDNAQSEFSGFQKIVRDYRETIQSFDIIHFVTSAFDQLYTGYLQYFSPAHLYPVLHRPLCLGHIDTYDEPIVLDGNKSQNWIRTCFFFLSPRSVDLLKTFNHFNNTDQIIDDSGAYITNWIIDQVYANYLRQWLGGEKLQGVAWHGSIHSQDELKRKTLAILNEHNLSIQLQSKGIDLIDYYWLAENIDAVESAFDFPILESMKQVNFRQSSLYPTKTNISTKPHNNQ